METKKTEEEWSYQRNNLMAKVYKSDEVWKDSIGMKTPIGAGFSKNFPSREEAIHFATEYFSKKFGK